MRVTQVRDNVKREITTELGQCIQAPRAARGLPKDTTPKGPTRGTTPPNWNLTN